MQIKKTYKDINPEMLYDEVKDLVQKQGAVLDEAKLQTYSLPGGSAHISRATLIFKGKGEQQAEKECVRVHIVGTLIGETKMMIDIDETLFPPQNISALEEDLGFMFGSYEGA